MNSKMVVGTWRLENFQIEDEDGKRAWGKNLRGLLIYTLGGHMSVSINKDIESDGDNESENILDSILFYSGTYRVDGDKVFHQVTVASSPARVGKEMVRQARLDGDTLTLDTPPDASPKATLVWKRIAQ